MCLLLLEIDHGQPGSHDLEFILIRQPGVLFREEVKVRLANGLRGIGQPEHFGVGLADHYEAAVGVLEVDVVRDVLQERFQQGPLLDNVRLRPQPLGHLADKEHEAGWTPVNAPNEFAAHLYRNDSSALEQGTILNRPDQFAGNHARDVRGGAVPVLRRDVLSDGVADQVLFPFPVEHGHRGRRNDADAAFQIRNDHRHHVPGPEHQVASGLFAVVAHKGHPRVGLATPHALPGGSSIDTSCDGVPAVITGRTPTARPRSV